MNYQFHAVTDPGRARDNNEDSVAFDEEALVAVLADGMGGYNAGEIASGMATAFIKSELSRWLIEAGALAQSKEIRRAMEICVDNANLAIYNSANANPAFAGMGTTLVLGVFKDGRLLVGHIGDSRCYRLRSNTLEQITKDHSLLQEQIDAGLITQEQAAVSPIKNLVTRALGVEQSVMLEVNEFSVEPGDLYLMCSDGLSDMVADEVIARIAGEASGLDQIAGRLVSAANENGGKDNISVLMVAVNEAAEKKGLIARLLGK
ncbi:Stp1/IreP family PP2C-type Ser/Thr phosphatase [Rhodoferax mekongensis]|uniref:Stp1/IreP family PP2C-type Ser/Thr phosphatase n=1 Tax=Rhodoferax mekongensis TaxID=3068341 RepID=A0ABZ0B0X5_9BURK|nr:Stp1/IreP family PP2C-type Ser/Thr phosphatase [Rhodoferax sp. TBRC 17307]WNO05564.1 Stp1/IreP family PP2C-type Ser/Thr phosphatase [Rhodoferax sp. TBRC 17307]